MKPKQLNIIYLLTIQLLLISFAVCQFTISNPGQKLSSNQTLVKNVTHEFNFTLNKIITVGSTVVLTFPSQYRIPSTDLSNCMASKSSSVALSSVTCSSVYSSGLDVYSIVFSGLYPTATTQNFLWLQFVINNPWADFQAKLDIYIKDSTSVTLQSMSLYVRIYASSLNSCSIDGATSITGDNVTQTIKFTPTRDLISGSFILVSMPMWFIGSMSSISNIGSSSLTCTGVSNTDNTSLPCSITNLTTAIQGINITNFVSSNKTTPGQIVIRIQNLRNPWSMLPFGQISFQLYYLSGQVSQRCKGIYKTVNTTNTFRLTSFNITKLEISSNNTGIQLILAVNNPAMRNRTRIRIDHSSQITVTYSGSGSIASQKSNQIIFTNVATSDRTSGSLLLFSFTVITPVSTRPFSIKFTTQFVDSSATNFYDIDSSSITLANNAGVIISASVTPSDYSINVIANYQIIFTSPNKLVSGSFIQIIFPSTLTINANSTCTSNITSVSSCSISSSSSNLTLQISNVIIGSTSFSIQVTNIKNAPNTVQSSSFKIYSYYYSSAYDSLVDKIQSNITVKMTANQIVTASVTPNNLTTYTITSYNFAFTLKDDIPKNGYIQIQLPSTVFAITGSVTLDSASFSISTCSISLSGQIIKILNCFLSSAMTNKAVNLTLNGIRNPQSLKPTTSFMIRTYSSSSLLNLVQNNLIVTMTQAYSLSSFSLIPSISTVHSTSQVTIEIIHVVPCALNDYLTLSFDDSMNITSSLNCSAVSGVNSISCVRVSNSQLKITYSSLPSSQTLKYLIQSIQNYDIADTNVNFNILIYGSDNYLKQKATTAFQFIQTSITSFSINNDDDIILYDYSKINVTLSSPFTISSNFNISLTKLQIYFPTDVTTALNTTCVVPSGTCTVINSTKLQISSIGFSFLNYSIIMSNILLPFINVQSSSFTIIYSYNNKNISYIDSNLVIKPYCTSPCKKCDVNKTKCVTCMPSPNTQKYFNQFTFKCQSVCPDGTYPDSNNVCQNCISPCKKCTDVDNCTSCVTNTWLYQSRCYSVCPDGFYNLSSSTSNYCVGCQAPCITCSNATFCLSCQSKYLTPLGTCVDQTQCPAGTYPNSTELKCKSCPSGCTSCVSSTNCTSCNTSIYFFYNYTCITQCPSGTYKSNLSCQLCKSPCTTCSNTQSNCTSCITSTFLNNNACDTQCPIGKYQNILNNICSLCKTQCYDCNDANLCTECSGLLYLTSAGRCLSSCPTGQYQNNVNHKCQPCTSPCSNCQYTATNCTSCIPNQVLYNNNCGSTTCPSQYFNVNGVCKTCGNCNNCQDVYTCIDCKTGYFLYGGICYSTCPSTAPIPEISSQTCIICDPSCQNCKNSVTNCTSCKNRQYLFNYGCYSSCPTGYIENIFTRECQIKQLSNMFYFPSLFSLLSLIIILGYSKYYYRQTQFVTIFTAFISLCCFFSWLIFVTILYMYQASIQKSILDGLILINLICIILSFIFGIGYQIYLKLSFNEDQGLQSWRKHNSLNQILINLFTFCSLPNFILFRFLYGRMFHREYFSVCFLNGGKLFSVTHKLTLCSILFQLFPMIGVTFYTIYNKETYDQTVYSALDSLVLNVMLIILLFIDGSKNGEQFFGQMKKKLPFIKGNIKGNKDKYMQVQSMRSFIDLQQQDSQYNEKKRIKTQIPQKDKQKYFRKITCIDDLNKFGHLNKIQTPDQEQTKSLPQLKKLRNLARYNNYKLGQDQNVMDDLFFNSEEQLMDQEKRKQAQRLKKEMEFQEAKNKAQYDKYKNQEQRKYQEMLAKQKSQNQRLERERLQKLLQDQIQQQNLQCIDIAAIDKAQGKGKQKKSPLDLLGKKTVDDKPIDQKALKKLQQIAKKNGIDPQFMKQTFGIQKNHNQQLLNSIIDKHNHVNRQAVKQMFKQTNNKDILQQLFSKNSNIDTQKLKNLMNDKQGIKMIQKLMNQQNGILSADIAKILLDKNSKFNPEFIKNLLSGNTGADDAKLQDLLRNAENQKQRQNNLKALKKIGGDCLQNKELIENMLGNQASLNPQQFSKVANNLSTKSIQNLFKKTNPYKNQVVNKLLNNKKLNLKQLSPILQDQQLVYELGKQLANGNQIIEQNLINLMKNVSQDMDPQKLKQLIQNPLIVEKLLGNSILDPAFLTQILMKNNNTNFQLLEKALENMKPEDIEKIFQFTGQKNLDYKSLSKLFNYNSNTDPELVKKMLDPQLVSQIYRKNNNIDPKILKKLVQKGSKFDKQNIINIYGSKTDNLFNQQNIINKQKNQGEIQETEYDYKYNFNKTANQNFNLSQRGDIKKKVDNQIAMSRTDGGMMGFFNPMNLAEQKTKNRFKGKLKDQMGMGDFDDLDQQLGDQDEDQDYQNRHNGFGLQGEIIQEQDQDEAPGRRKKAALKKRKLKKITDIRHPSQKIYLEPIIAPHQLQMSKQFRKKKKKDQNKSATKLIMDEDNDIFDIDF